MMMRDTYVLTRRTWYLCSGNTSANPSAPSIKSLTSDPDMVPPMRRSESYTFVPSESCLQVSIAIATASPVSIFICYVYWLNFRQLQQTENSQCQDLLLLLWSV